jgi:putative flippase GtrA
MRKCGIGQHSTRPTARLSWLHGIRLHTPSTLRYVIINGLYPEKQGRMTGKLQDRPSLIALIKQMLKFSVVGITAFLIDYVLLWVFTEFVGFDYTTSNILSYTIGTIYNYVLSVRWVFSVRSKHSQQVIFIVFVVLSLIGLGINQLLLVALVEVGGWGYMLAKLIASIIVSIYNYVTRKIYLEGRGRMNFDG